MNGRNEPIFLRICDSPWGPVTILWGIRHSDVRIFRIILSSSAISSKQKIARSQRHIPQRTCPEIDGIVDGFGSFFHGNPLRFSLDLADMSGCSEFQRSVLLAEHAVRRGAVTTYGRLAKHVGKPGGARAAGSALAGNPFPVLIPCHRAIRSDGTLGGFQGGIEMKRALLELEGIRLDTKGRVLEPDFDY